LFLWIIFFFIKEFVLVWDWFLFEEFIKLMRFVVKKGLVLYWILSLIILHGCWPVLFFWSAKRKEPKEKPPAVTTKLLRVNFGLKRTNALASLT
jgi:hypothetical protein